MAFNSERDNVGSKRYEVLYPLHEIDSFNGEELKNHIISIIDETDIIIIDFTKIAYLNSSGLRELIQILKILREKYKELYLVHLSEAIKKIFVHTNLDRLFTFHENLQAALDSVKD